MSAGPIEPEDLPAAPEAEALGADEALAALESLTVGAPDLVVAEEPLAPIGRSWAFDFTKDAYGAFYSAPAHGPLETYGLETLRYWIEKCLRTARGAHPIHHADYGMVRPRGEVSLAVEDVPGDLEERVREALTFHPRITGVDYFEQEVVESDDVAEAELRVSFTVELDNDDPLRVEGLIL